MSTAPSAGIWVGAAMAALTLSAAAPAARAETVSPEGAWMLPRKAAVQIYQCDGRLCGRIVWLDRPRDPDGRPVRDKKNPDPALRPRLICGQTVLRDLMPSGPDRWTGGSLYNPDDGHTYRIRGELIADTIIARIYMALPVLGQTSIWRRVPHLNADGWC